jgi:hypothetical protein
MKEILLQVINVWNDNQNGPYELINSDHKWQIWDGEILAVQVWSDGTVRQMNGGYELEYLRIHNEIACYLNDRF